MSSIETQPILKCGRKKGSKLPTAVCNDVDKCRARKLRQNVAYRKSLSYIRTKIKMVCKNNNIPFPELQDKTEAELNSILLELKINRLRGLY